jgi:O-antigen/teichoic acid export membrane protein
MTGDPAIKDLVHVPRQASIRFAGLAFDKLLGYVFALFVAKAYGSNDLGLYLFGVGLIEVLVTLARLGQERAAVRLVASLKATEKNSDIAAAAGAALSITLGPALALASAVYFLSGQMADALARPELAEFLRAAAPALPAIILADAFLWTTEGMGAQRYVSLIRLGAEPVTRVTLTALLFLILGDSADAGTLGLVYTISVMGTATLSYITYRRLIPHRAATRHARDYVKGLIATGLPVWGQMVLAHLLARSDLFLIFSFISATAAAHYTVGLRTALLPMMISMAFDAALRPAIAGALAKGEHGHLKAQFLQVARSVLMLCLPAIVILQFFPERVMSVIGAQFIDASRVVSLVAAGTLAGFLTGPASSALVMAGLARIPFVNGLIAGAVRLTLCLALIPTLGMTGAAIAQLASTVTSNALDALAARRSLGVVGISRGHVPLLIAAMAATAAGLLADALAPANAYAALAAVSASVLFVYSAAVAMIGVTAEDRELMRSLFNFRPRRHEKSETSAI